MTTHDTAYERNAPDARVVDRALAGSQQGVFWLEDVRDEMVPHPPLTGTADADLTVVGGGYTGLWTAVLAKRRNPGAQVVLLEAETIGWAASGRNGGFCEASLTHGEANGRTRWPEEYDTLARLGDDNLAAIVRDVADLGLDCHLERTGVMTVAVEPHQVAWLAQEAGGELLDAAAARASIDSPLFLAAHWEREGTALVHPARLATELARAAVELGVEIHEHSAVTGLDSDRAGGPVTVRTANGLVRSERVALGTNVFPSLVRRTRLHTVPVYDYVIVTEPLSTEQLASIGWTARQGLADLANQFHYSRLSADNRIMLGGYDAIYRFGGRVRAEYEDRPASHRTLVAHLLALFPQLEGLGITHRWAGAIDTSTRFCAFHGTARGGRVAYAAGFTGLGVGATRFAAEVMLDRLSGLTTERTELEMVRTMPLPFPPEPIASAGINLTRWSLDRADHREGQRNLLLRALDSVGLGFDS
ncbi:MAG: FAD-dependent oxidoreductase [Aeromicrobium sp.]|jgi:glycine/D-amino acid oxidase-like deaminating enzyme|nr:FAD-dependent oxidoreductase [Aeromicrobium sp.]